MGRGNEEKSGEEIELTLRWACEALVYTILDKSQGARNRAPRSTLFQASVLYSTLNS